MEDLINIIKETSIDLVKKGESLSNVAKQISSKFGNDVSRLIIIDIALDLGKKEEAKKYINQF